MHRGMYDFNLDRNKPLVVEAFRAVNRIYTAGIMLRDGKVTVGGNNVMADSAATAFNEDDLNKLKASNDPRQEGAAAVIALRQQFAGISAARDQSTLLQKIYDKVQDMKKAGWKPEGEPHALRGPRPA